MAFFRKAGSILGRTASANINQEVSLSKPSILQTIRCMSTSKLFIGAKVIVDRETGRSRGFGFVTYSSSEEASAAIQALDQKELHGRPIRVNCANDRPRGGGYGGGGYGGGGYGGGGSYGDRGGGYGVNYGSGGD